MDVGGKRFCPYDSVFRSLEMVVAKSEARRDPTAYFRAARPWPLLITALGLGYYAVGVGSAGACWQLWPLFERRVVAGGQFCARAWRLPLLLLYTEVRWALRDF